MIVFACAGVVDVVLSYCHYCLNDTTLEDHLQYLQEKQVSHWTMAVQQTAISATLHTCNTIPPIHCPVVCQKHH